jgi:phosphoserine aminotransferase
MPDWHGTGMSVLEMSHRGPEFESIIAKAEADLRTLMKVPDNYKARAFTSRQCRAPARA